MRLLLSGLKGTFQLSLMRAEVTCETQDRDRELMKHKQSAFFDSRTAWENLNAFIADIGESYWYVYMLGATFLAK